MKIKHYFVLFVISIIIITVSIYVIDFVYISRMTVVLPVAGVDLFIIQINNFRLKARISFLKVMVHPRSEIYDKLYSFYRNNFSEAELKKELCLANIEVENKDYISILLTLLVFLIASMTASVAEANSIGMRAYAMQLIVNYAIFIIESIIFISIACYIDKTIKTYIKMKKYILENRINKIQHSRNKIICHKHS